MSSLCNVIKCPFVCELGVFFGFMSSLVHSVFWDLYCAAPERRETCDHSSEAKAFHDYVSTAYKETVANIAFCSPGEDNKFVLEAEK